ncbi:MAG: pyridoxal phosphate-dependent aminotransferase [Eubacteriales bacterium]|nr:pyridoxal phosphate-dependent aminotransferase [Eubacteriales bacterium]
MIAKAITDQLEQGSWIRRMFEEGNRLRAIHGADHVYDFSLGNPDLEPPEAVRQAIISEAGRQQAGSHGYMSNVGYAGVREAISRQISQTSGRAVEADAVCMTVGAAGALNVTLKALLDPDDEVIVIAPYFVDYLSYIRNHGGRPVVVEVSRATLVPDLDAVERAITPKTKAIIINTPNNPTGMVYSEGDLRALNQVIDAQDHPIYIISDEPYRELVFTQRPAPSTMACLNQVIVCYSWSKSFSLPGERIGYVAVSPGCHDYDQLKKALGFCNRVLGYVNAPAFFQRVIEQSLNAPVDVSRYRKRRDLLAGILRRAGFSLRMPEGGFYLFPRSPREDDVAFAEVCAAEHVLVVPGTGFGFSGYFRLCFAVPDAVIEASEPAFRRIAENEGLQPG